MADDGSIEGKPGAQAAGGGDDGWAAALKARARHHARQLIDHLWGPSGSVILHVLLVVLLVRLVTFNDRTRDAEIEVIVVEPEAVDLDEFKRELEKPKEPPPDIRPPDAQVPVEPPPVDEPFRPRPEDDLAALDIRSDVRGPVIMRNLFSGRDAGMRGKLLDRFAGRYGSETEAAVLKALEWLKEHQLEDGSWAAEDGKHKTAMTGLGLLTFLAHGETTASERYGPTVERAIRFLAGNVRESGDFASGSDEGYGHGMAAYALSEAYALTRIAVVKTAMERSVGRIVRGQEPDGGFTYGLSAGASRADTSVMGWQIQAMKAALVAGADIPGLREAVDQSARCLATRQFDAGSGMFRYATEAGKAGGKGRPSNTAMATLCLQLTGWGGRPEAASGVKALSDITCTWGEAGGFGGHTLYSWYYATQVKFHAGESVFKEWNDQFARALVAAQNDDGSWTPFSAAEQKIGPVYGTTFCALTLMVYYRVLPTYQPIEIGAPETPGSGDDVTVDII